MPKEGEPIRRKPIDSTGGGRLDVNDIIKSARAKADDRARKHLGELQDRQTQLTEAREFLASGDLKPQEFSLLEQNFRQLVSKPERDTALKRALERLARLPQEEVREAEKKEHKPTLLKNLNLSRKEEELMEGLWNTSKDNPKARAQLREEIYGGVSKKIGNHRLEVLLSRTRKKLKGSELEILNATPPGGVQEGNYYLQRPGQETVARPERRKKEIRETKVPLPKGLRLSTHVKELIVALSQTSKDNTKSGKEIDKELYKGVPNKLRSHRRDQLIRRANEQLGGIGFKIVNVTPRGSIKGGNYYLEVPERVQTEAVERAKKVQKTKAEVIELPDGKNIKVSRLEKILVEGLLCGSFEKPVSSSELIKLLYDEKVPKEVAKVRLYRIFSEVRKKLDAVGWKVVNLIPFAEGAKGKEAMYYLAPKEIVESVEEEIPQEEEVFGQPEVVQREQVGEPSLVEETPLGGTGEPREEVVPYVPSEEEKRSEEETRILGVIVSQILSKGRLYFVDLQKELYSPERERTMPGYKRGERVEFRIYEGAELKIKFLSALGKIREESEIPALRNTWSEEDRNLWNSLQTLVNKLSGGDAEDFIKKVRLEIDRAERKFRADFKPGENWTGWIEKKKN